MSGVLAYRFLTEEDTSAFCHKVTAALAGGWSLYGDPAYVFDAAAGRMRCGQAVTKEVEASLLRPTMKLGAALNDEGRLRAASSRTTASARRIAHAVPRTVTEGDRALYRALYPRRFALYSSDAFARACGLPRSPLEDLAAFHVVFGKTVPDISLNAVANLGYAEGRFLRRSIPATR